MNVEKKEYGGKLGGEVRLHDVSVGLNIRLDVYSTELMFSDLTVCGKPPVNLDHLQLKQVLQYSVIIHCPSRCFRVCPTLSVHTEALNPFYYYLFLYLTGTMDHKKLIQI